MELCGLAPDQSLQICLPARQKKEIMDRFGYCDLEFACLPPPKGGPALTRGALSTRGGFRISDFLYSYYLLLFTYYLFRDVYNGRDGYD